MTDDTGYFHVNASPKTRTTVGDAYQKYSTHAHSTSTSIKSAIISEHTAVSPMSKKEMTELLAQMESRIMQQVCDELSRIEQVIMEALSDD